jgi:hypothetical protein
MAELRTCAKCGVEDEAPHHVQYVAFNHPVEGHGIDLSVSKHVECCAEDGCAICSTDVQRANQDNTDIDTFVRNRPGDHLQTLFEQFSVETPEYSVPGTAEER